jgi:leader peptidase (prepilin peptidase)/N-methyltransferase
MPSSFDLWASKLITEGSVVWLVAVAAVLGWLVSRWCWHWVDCLTWERSPWTSRICPHCGVNRLKPALWQRVFSFFAPLPCPACGAIPSQSWFSSLVVALLFALFAWSVGKLQCQSLTEGGSVDWIHWRILYHLTLITLLIVATAIDFRVYLIPDSITVTGVILGILGATWFGNLQLIPVWINANLEIPRLAGPYIPAWIKEHGHWHGLAWSLAGLIAGGGITWLVREISSRILGQEAMGFGDVTLMAMIGSFIGWQPVLLVFILSPVCAIPIAIAARFSSGKTYVPYGPYLSAATLVVLLTWRWFWPPLKYVFGHPPTIGLLVGGALLTMVILLSAIRGFRAIPTTRS